MFGAFYYVKQKIANVVVNYIHLFKSIKYYKYNITAENFRKNNYILYVDASEILVEVLTPFFLNCIFLIFLTNNLGLLS